MIVPETLQSFFPNFFALQVVIVVLAFFRGCCAKVWILKSQQEATLDFS